MRIARFSGQHLMLVLMGGVGVGPKVNKFEQVSNDDHQMSLAEVRMSREGWVCPEGVPVPVPCALSHDACDVT